MTTCHMNTKLTMDQVLQVYAWNPRTQMLGWEDLKLCSTVQGLQRQPGLHDNISKRKKKKGNFENRPEL